MDVQWNYVGKFYELILQVILKTCRIDQQKAPWFESDFWATLLTIHNGLFHSEILPMWQHRHNYSVSVASMITILECHFYTHNVKSV